MHKLPHAVGMEPFMELSGLERRLPSVDARPRRRRLPGGAGRILCATSVPDVYATITEAEPLVVEQIAEILELRAADPQQRAMREAYLSEIELPEGARVLEVGCGPGPVSRALTAWPRVGEVVGIDPSPIFLAEVRELASPSQDPLLHGGGRPSAALQERVVRRGRLPHDALPRPRPGASPGRSISRPPPGRLARGLRRRLCDDDGRL